MTEFGIDAPSHSISYSSDDIRPVTPISSIILSLSNQLLTMIAKL